jgi:hypothetical protein
MKTQQQLDRSARITDIIEIVLYTIFGAAVAGAALYGLCATAGIVPTLSL